MSEEPEAPRFPDSPPVAPTAQPPWAPIAPAPTQWAPPSSGPGFPPQPPYQPPAPPVGGGTAGWPPYAPPPGPAPRSPLKAPDRRAAVLVAAMIVLAALVGLVAGAALAPDRASHASPSTASADRSATTDTLPTPSTGSASAPALTTDQIAAKVDPAIVDLFVTFTQGSGAGTGIVLTSSGLVLTNNHVIANSTKIEADLVGTDKKFAGTVLGYDVTDDVALVQLQDASGLPTVTVGDSKSVNPGDDVVALGNALGKGGTPAVAEGQVTQLDQSIDVVNDDGTTATLSGLIETSARLQPGDSGGPLVDRQGEVIGMDAAASTNRRGATTNDSYAIPIDTALDIAHKIQAGESTNEIHVGDRALLGVQVQDARRPTIQSVEPGSPAEKAGMASGDTITSIDGKNVQTLDDIRAALDSHHPGDDVTVTWVDSGGQSHSASLTLIAGPPA